MLLILTLSDTTLWGAQIGGKHMLGLVVSRRPQCVTVTQVSGATTARMMSGGLLEAGQCIPPIGRGYYLVLLLAYDSGLTCTSTSVFGSCRG